MVDLGLFLIGAGGALVTVYIAKDEIIPEFRPLFDASEKIRDASEKREKITRTEKEIDDVQSRLQKGTISENLAARLETVLDTSLTEVRTSRKRLEELEKDIKQGQVVSRTLGFLFFIVLGGLFGSLLAGRVQVEGLSGDLPTLFQSLLIGATWTSYLSTIGFRSGQKKAEEEIEAAKKKLDERIDQGAKDAVRQVTRTTPAENQPDAADEFARLIAEAAKDASHQYLDTTKLVVQRRLKSVL